MGQHDRIKVMIVSREGDSLANAFPKFERNGIQILGNVRMPIAMVNYETVLPDVVIVDCSASVYRQIYNLCKAIREFHDKAKVLLCYYHIDRPLIDGLRDKGLIQGSAEKQPVRLIEAIKIIHAGGTCL